MRHYKLAKLPFICVFEATKLGWPHLHILLRSQWIDQRWLSAQMADLIQSPVVDIRRIKSRQQVVSYVAKYCGKAPKQFGSCKRYWKSQDYEQRKDRLNPAPLEAGTYFEVLPYHIKTVISNWIGWGYPVEIEGTRCARARPP